MSASLLLDVQGVSKYFGGLQANEDVSFQVNPGEIVSIIGPNGAGKSTLFSCVTGFHRVDKGRIFFKGREITNQKPHKIGKIGIARTFQIVQVISDMTVLENVMTGGFLRHTRVPDVRRKAEEVLAFTGLIEKKNFNALALTISDKKRLEVSMALGTKPMLLMLTVIHSARNLILLLLMFRYLFHQPADDSQQVSGPARLIPLRVLQVLSSVHAVPYHGELT